MTSPTKFLNVTLKLHCRCGHCDQNLVALAFLMTEVSYHDLDFIRIAPEKAISWGDLGSSSII